MRNIWLYKPTNKRYILIYSLEKLNEYTIPPFKSLRAFESAGRNLSFTLAAEDLNVTPGAISQQIRQLEDFLEVKLFKRMNRAIVLTDAGQLFLPIMVKNEVIKIGRSRIEAACRAEVLECSCCYLKVTAERLLPEFDVSTQTMANAC